VPDDDTYVLDNCALIGYPISYEDAFTAAAAKIYDAILFTGDPEFKSLKNKGIIKVKWLNP
jgi:predicted nucleic acid-binding protein